MPRRQHTWCGSTGGREEGQGGLKAQLKTLLFCKTPLPFLRADRTGYGSCTGSVYPGLGMERDSAPWLLSVLLWMAALNSSLGLAFKCSTALLYPKFPWYFKEITPSEPRTTEPQIGPIWENTRALCSPPERSSAVLAFTLRRIYWASHSASSKFQTALQCLRGYQWNATPALRQGLVSFLLFNSFQFLLHGVFFFSLHYWGLYRHRRTIQKAEATMWLGIKEIDFDRFRVFL